MIAEWSEAQWTESWKVAIRHGRRLFMFGYLDSKPNKLKLGQKGQKAIVINVKIDFHRKTYHTQNNCVAKAERKFNTGGLCAHSVVIMGHWKLMTILETLLFAPHSPAPESDSQPNKSAERPRESALVWFDNISRETLRNLYDRPIKSIKFSRGEFVTKIKPHGTT